MSISPSTRYHNRSPAINTLSFSANKHSRFGSPRLCVSVLILRGSLARQGFKDYISRKLSAASPICDFPSPIGEQQQLFKEGEGNSPLQSYYCANGRGAPRAPKCNIDISTKLRCTQIIPILLPSTQKPEEPENHLQNPRIASFSHI
jgi:hypothetical protein